MKKKKHPMFRSEFTTLANVKQISLPYNHVLPHLAQFLHRDLGIFFLYSRVSPMSSVQLCLSFVNVVIEFSNTRSAHKSMARFSPMAYPCHMWSFIFLISLPFLSPIYKNASCSATAVHHSGSLAICCP